MEETQAPDIQMPQSTRAQGGPPDLFLFDKLKFKLHSQVDEERGEVVRGPVQMLKYKMSEENYWETKF